MKQCKCEHWQECPVCQPKRFDAEGNRLPPEPTPLQAARARVAELEAALDEALKALEDGAAFLEHIADYDNAKLKDVRREQT